MKPIQVIALRICTCLLCAFLLMPLAGLAQADTPSSAQSALAPLAVSAFQEYWNGYCATEGYQKMAKRTGKINVVNTAECTLPEVRSDDRFADIDAFIVFAAVCDLFGGGMPVTQAYTCSFMKDGTVAVAPGDRFAMTFKTAYDWAMLEGSTVVDWGGQYNFSYTAQ